MPAPRSSNVVVSSGSASMYVPMLFRNAWGSYDSALYVQDVDADNAADISIQYYDTDGNLTCSRDDSLLPLSSHGYWIPSECVPDGWVGGAVITANHDIVAVGRPHLGSRITTYDGFASGSMTAYTPMLFKNAWGSYDSALYVQNVDPDYSAGITIKYYDTDGNLTCSHDDNIPPLSSHGYWIPSECVPDGWVGGAVITADHGNADELTFPDGSVSPGTPYFHRVRAPHGLRRDLVLERGRDEDVDVLLDPGVGGQAGTQLLVLLPDQLAVVLQADHVPDVVERRAAHRRARRGSRRRRASTTRRSTTCRECCPGTSSGYTNRTSSRSTRCKASKSRGAANTRLSFPPANSFLSQGPDTLK